MENKDSNDVKSGEKLFGRLADALGHNRKGQPKSERSEGCGIGCLFSLIGVLGIPFGVLSNLTKRYSGRR